MKRSLQTTIAGSLPKPAWLCPPRQLWAPWLLEGDALAEGKRDAVRLVLRDQEHAGIDIVTDGEQTRRHFVTTFIEGLDGVDFEHRRTVRIRNRYDADVPVVVGPVSRRAPVFVEDAHFLRSATERKVKFTLPGPMTMVDTLYDDHYKSREKLAWAFAGILNEEARAIAATGVDVIQFDEPAFNVYLDEVRDWGIAALERAAAGTRRARPPCTSATATGSRPTSSGRRRWAPSGGSTRRPSRCWPRSKIDQVSLECANSRVPIDLIGLLGDKDVLVGAIDVASENGRDAGGGRGDDPRGAGVRAAGAALPLHQLRDGAAAARGRARQARGAGGGRSAGPPRTRLTRAAWPRYRDAGKKARESPKPSRAPTDQAADGVTARCRCRCRSC